MEVYDSSYIPKEIHRSSEILDSLWVPSSSFQAMVNFEVERSDNPDHGFDQTGFHPSAEKKRRLKASQVKFLEKSFEADNKLEPDRKIQLAKELGLHPRQVAIWFQNRRARYKTKFLEKEYDSLKTSYDALKKDYDSLSAHNQKLQNEIQLLMQKLEPRKQEDGGASSWKSDVLDSDSPWADSDLDEDERGLHLQPKLEVQEYLMPNSCGLGYPIQDQVQGTWFWHY